MSKQKILIFGYGGHAKVVADIISCQKKYSIAGFVVDKPPTNVNKKDKIFLESNLSKLKIQSGIIALGDNWQRFNLYKKIIQIFPKFKFIVAIHPSATVSKSATIAGGTVIMPKVVVGPDCHIQSHSILNTASSIDHDCRLSDFCSLAPGVILGGNVSIGNHSAIGLGANVIQGIKVGDNSVVGAGSAVLDDIDSNCVAFGAPCVRQRERQVGEKYL